MQTSDAAPAADDDRTPSAPGPARLLDRSAVRLREDLAAGALSAREVTEAALAAAQAAADAEQLFRAAGGMGAGAGGRVRGGAGGGLHGGAR
ncbi:hypothetical protein [Micrococcus luteus]|uniref:hypothetical protein n=1 Tax=Micrococcus luteus TaxID=1270 RepID=UPI0020127B58|nr:hypothetical protein [Micrococcus luteus]